MQKEGTLSFESSVPKETNDPGRWLVVSFLFLFFPFPFFLMCVALYYSTKKAWDQ